jgi:hypothetical protein
MKIRSLGLAVLGPVIVALIGFALSRGLYVGSAIDVSMRQGEGKFLYSKSCHYLYLDGVRDITHGSESSSREGAETTSCALLADLN